MGHAENAVFNGGCLFNSGTLLLKNPIAVLVIAIRT
jgi:hypothetical protein